MSTPNENERSESIEISSNDTDGQTTTHTEVTEDGKKVVDETHPGDTDITVRS